MINQSRLNGLDSMLQHLSGNTAAGIHAFHAALVAAGFDKAAALALTQTVLGSLLAVPDPSEQQPAH